MKKQNKRPVGFLNKDEAAAMLGCCKRTVDNLVAANKLPYYKLFSRLVAFKESDILEYLESCRVATTPINDTHVGISSGQHIDDLQKHA